MKQNLNFSMKLVLISDTHGRHTQLDLPDGDLLIHSGDISMRGSREETLRFLGWFNSMPHKHKIFIAGNHDMCFEQDPRWIDKTLKKFPNVTYLCDSGIEIDGINIWGSPVQPWFHNWAFNRIRNTVNGQYDQRIYNGIQDHWSLIPENTDILITHGPPFKQGDLLAEQYRRSNENPHVGCEDLLREIQTRVKPKLNVFGHIHENGGYVKSDGVTLFVNSSSIDEDYCVKKDPYVTFTWEELQSKI